MIRGKPGLKFKAKGRPITELNGIHNADTIIYWIAWKHKFWKGYTNRFTNKLIWEFYKSKTAANTALKRVSVGAFVYYYGELNLSTLLESPQYAE